jgi:hypothetical protein
MDCGGLSHVLGRAVPRHRRLLQSDLCDWIGETSFSFIWWGRRNRYPAYSRVPNGSKGERRSDVLYSSDQSQITACSGWSWGVTAASQSHKVSSAAKNEERMKRWSWIGWTIIGVSVGIAAAHQFNIPTWVSFVVAIIGFVIAVMTERR